MNACTPDPSDPVPPEQPLPVLEYLQRDLAGTLGPRHRTHLRYPTPVSALLGFRITRIAARTASLSFDADVRLHANQQGTVHGGMLAELADAAIGTAHSTVVAEGESFASIDLRVTFVRPVWSGTLVADAEAVHAGRTISHYRCDLTAEGRPVAFATSAVMTLRGDDARGR